MAHNPPLDYSLSDSRHSRHWSHQNPVDPTQYDSRPPLPPTSSNAAQNYLQIQPTGLDLSPVQYRESSQRTRMDHPSAYGSRPHGSSARAPATRRESDPLRIQVDHRPLAPRADSSSYVVPTHHPYRHTQRANSFSGMPYSYPPSSRQPSSSSTNEMNHMLSEFSLDSPTFSSSSASPSSPYLDRKALHPSMHTMRVHPDCLEPVDDHENPAALYSLIQSSDVTPNKNPEFATQLMPPIPDQNGSWPMAFSATDRNYPNPSRSASSQSSASHSTSESDSAPNNSSFPIGVARRTSNAAPSTTSSNGTPRKNKMHKCSVCDKWFPRPSGLATHMNTHSGAKPYKCIAPTCDKSFAVRSNAKRHFKTHGLHSPPSEIQAPQSSFNVGFEAPYVAPPSYDSGEALPQLKWVATGTSSQMDTDALDSPSGSDEVDGGPVPPSPLSAVYPQGPSFSSGDRYDETHQYASN